MRASLAHLVEDPEGLGEDEFLTAFEAFAQAVRRARGAPALASGSALTLSQYSLLQGLADRDVARVSDLAAGAGVTPSTATRILDALERRGIVSRTRPPEDRRAVAITLTDTGRAVLSFHHRWFRERQRSFYASLPGVERELAPDLLVRLAALIDELATGP
jgi:DNA-binding MarR family transcriptional regulator